MTAKRRTDNYLSWKAERIEAISDVDDSRVLRDSKRALNIFRKNKDFESSDGWSLAVNYRNLNALKGSNIGVFMVNLNKVSSSFLLSFINLKLMRTCFRTIHFTVLMPLMYPFWCFRLSGPLYLKRNIIPCYHHMVGWSGRKLRT